ncbi:hypothetical protein ACOACO_03850 [Nocardioides sp. CPCC 205120]|uniref:hypothetical protein n=1 Tax=Nocardioides sp. CPCC 205120 TaxID=3406462 RepID=UPI003B50B191
MPPIHPLFDLVAWDLAPRWFDGDESVVDDLPADVALLAKDRYDGPGLQGAGFEGRDLAATGCVAAEVVVDDEVSLMTVDFTVDPEGHSSPGGWGAGSGPGPRLSDPATRPSLGGSPFAPICAPHGNSTMGRLRSDVLRLRDDVVSVRVGTRELAVPAHGTVTVVGVRGVDELLTVTSVCGISWSGTLEDLDRLFYPRIAWDVQDEPDR